MLGAALIAAAMSGGVVPPPPIVTPVSIGTASQVSGTAATMTLTTTVTANPGDFVFIMTAGSGSQVSTAVSDGLGNTYSNGINYVPGGTALRTWWTVATNTIPSGTGIVITFGATATGAKYACAGKSGAIVAPGSASLDIEGAGASATSTTPSITTGTLSQANNLILIPTFVANGSAETLVETSGGVALNSVVSGLSVLHASYLITTATTPVVIAEVNGTPPVSRAWLINYQAFKGVAP